MEYKMYEIANAYFRNFLNDNFNPMDSKVEHKVNHTYFVVDNAKYSCEDMKLSNEDTDLAMVIALLHDIGRFVQAKEMKTFREDITDYDHATVGVKLLFEQNEIRNFVLDSKYDNIIKLAIGNHSKYLLDTDSLSVKEKLHCKIIRDADKLDSFRAKNEEDIYVMANITSEDIEKSIITDKIYNDFMQHKTIFSKDRKTGIDIWVSYIAFIYGLEFKSSYKMIKEKNYINKLFERFNYKLEKEKMIKLQENALKYLESQLN